MCPHVFCPAPGYWFQAFEIVCSCSVQPHYYQSRGTLVFAAKMTLECETTGSRCLACRWSAVADDNCGSPDAALWSAKASIHKQV